MKPTDELIWLNEVSSVPLQQAIRHQQAAYAAFFAKRARYPRFESRQGRQSASYTRSGVDLGIADFAVTSDGQRIPNPRHPESSQGAR